MSSDERDPLDLDDDRDRDARPEVEQPDDVRGSHNRIGYLNVDEGTSSSEAGGDEPGVAGGIEQPPAAGDRD